jgi:hypothetical protein
MFDLIKMDKVSKISYKTYLNDRLKQVDFHGQLTYPLYIQLTFERKTIFFKSYYFELLSKPRYFLSVAGLSKSPSIEEVIASENEVIDFIISKHGDDFSLEVFKQAYAYYSKDLCVVTENGFLDYLHTFFQDKGMPSLATVIREGASSCSAYEVVRDLKMAFQKPLYNEMIENALYYAPPYLPLYGFMVEIKKWPLLILTAMELERPETLSAFRDYIVKRYPRLTIEEVLRQVGKWPDYH